MFSGSNCRKKEGINSAKEFLKNVKNKNAAVEEFKHGFFSYDGRFLKVTFEHIKTNTKPDIIFTHNRDDLHQDHRSINQLPGIHSGEIYSSNMKFPNMMVIFMFQIIMSKLMIKLRTRKLKLKWGTLIRKNINPGLHWILFKDFCACGVWNLVVPINTLKIFIVEKSFIDHAQFKVLKTCNNLFNKWENIIRQFMVATRLKTAMTSF